MTFFTSGALLATLVLGTTWVLQTVLGRRRPSYPPGPKPKPFIGNALDFPTTNAAETYLEWGRKYNSGVLHFEALGNHIIVVNTVEDADELLEKRANIYSDRPVIPAAKLMGWDFILPLLRYNDDWRLQRKICHQKFRQGDAEQYFPMQIEKVHELLRNLLAKPKDFESHNKIFSISIPLSSMYGYDAKSLDDPCVRAADEGTVLAAQLLTPGTSFVNILPILGKIPAWVPGTFSVRTAALVRKWTKEMTGIPMAHAKKQVAEGKAVPSLVTEMLERKFADPTSVSIEEERAIDSIAYTIYGAASDTTIALTKAFFYYMARYPQVQRKAQEEIDQVVGSKRFPDFSDRDFGKMPYIEAIYREVLRLAAPLPLCVPHAASEDDYYKGYFIPKGATVLPNIWAMSHDEVRYPDPFAFKPERFLDASGQINHDDRIFAYGFGRRVCVGKVVGSATLWLAMVCVLACFNIDHAKDENGNIIEIDDEFEDIGIIRHKAKFDCSFNVRSADARQLVVDS